MQANSYFITTSPLKGKGKHLWKNRNMWSAIIRKEYPYKTTAYLLSWQDIPYAFWQLPLFFYNSSKIMAG